MTNSFDEAVAAAKAKQAETDEQISTALTSLVPEVEALMEKLTAFGQALPNAVGARSSLQIANLMRNGFLRDARSFLGEDDLLSDG